MIKKTDQHEIEFLGCGFDISSDCDRQRGPCIESVEGVQRIRLRDR